MFYSFKRDGRKGLCVFVVFPVSKSPESSADQPARASAGALLRAVLLRAGVATGRRCLLSGKKHPEFFGSSSKNIPTLAIYLLLSKKTRNQSKTTSPGLKKQPQTYPLASGWHPPPASLPASSIASAARPSPAPRAPLASAAAASALRRAP